MRRVIVPTYTALIYIGGDLHEAEKACQTYCDEVGLCVTVEPVRYLYTGGQTAGVRVGLINYGRFPSEPEKIFAHAETLAGRLLDALQQDSATILATDQTMFVSRRPEDIAT